jgi:hypothetical protein
MAGGMRGKREPGLSLAERSRLSGVGSVGSGPRRHCWVTGPQEDAGPFPGLVLQWQRTGDSWRAWVVYLVADDTAVMAWVPSSRLRPT